MPRRGYDYARPVRRILVALLVLVLLAVFVFWRIDSPRVERMRAQVTDAIVPRMDWAMAPVTSLVGLARDFRSYQRISEQNLELRRELRTVYAQAVATGYFVLALGIGVLFLLDQIQAGTVDVMLRDPIGQVALLVSGAIYAVGIITIRRMTRIEV